MQGGRGTVVSSDGVLARWARLIIRHRRMVLLTWAVLVIALGGIWKTNSGQFVKNLSLPGAESQRAVDLLRERFPAQAGDNAIIVVRAEAGMSAPAVQDEMAAMVADARAIPGVIGVVPPDVSAKRNVSADGTIGYAVVQFAEQADAVPDESVNLLHSLRDAHDRPEFQVELGGQVITASEHVPPGKSEVLGIIAAMIILLVAFGSLVAMGLPLLTAFAGLATSMFLIGLLAQRVDFASETRAFTAMIGIGVGIDYALFIVTRYREGLRQGLSVDDAVVTALGTAGRSILFAGSIVAVALLGLTTMGIPFVGALGLAAAIVVVLAVLVALTVLPALLVVIGPRIDRWRLPWPRSHAPREDHDSFWYRMADRTQRHPWLITIAGIAVLLVLSVPALDMRVGTADAGNNPSSLTSRRAYDLLSQGFGQGFNGPLVVALDLAGGSDPELLGRLSTAIKADPNVAFVSPPMFNEARDTAILTVIPKTSPQDVETGHLVDRLRGDIIPRMLQNSQIQAHVGGPTAAYIDMGNRITDRLPIFFGVVIGLSMLLLVVVFRSLVVPLQAAVMNVLSIGAAYGVLVAVFQWGWFSHLFGVDRAGPIESFLPMMLFAVLFGLSTDYEVFLMSRIHEAWLNRGDNRAAVNHGSATTMRVITAAAAIMVVVFLSFTLSDVRIVKEFGLGLATAIFIDATVIRMLLVPAVTGLLGSANWYLPAWLDRRLPKVVLEIPELEPVRLDAPGQQPVRVPENPQEWPAIEGPR